VSRLKGYVRRVQNVRILIVDDNTANATLLGDQLTQKGYSPELAATGGRALEIISEFGCDLVICDVRIEGMGDMELLDRVKKLQPTLPVIVVSAPSAVGQAVLAMKHGAFQYLTKPCDIVGLCRFVQSAADERERTPSTRSPMLESFEASSELVHVSSVMQKLVDSIALVAHSSAPVLILGESGTGKERVARAVHARGPRRSRPFVAVNTSAIPEQLIESEVFGHLRGSFTGATQARKGLLNEADGGTILLDEIGDMPMALQPKLLRVLQFGEVRAVGSDRARHVDVRVIAATHRDLPHLVRDGQFREDLRYRLNVIPLVVPALRDRREDIAPLATHFLGRARDRTPESPVESISEEAMRVLTAASWAGNARELENVVERLVVLGRDTMIMPKDLAFLETETPTLSPADMWQTAKRELWTVKQLNQRYLGWVLLQTGGDKTRAAEILGIDLSTLYRWQRAKD
jgi:two-component system response regulator HydG